MPFLIQYLIKLSISLAVVWIFYVLILRRLTFYNWNRWFLIGYSLLAFFIPFINISPVIEKTEWVNNKVVQFIPVVERFATINENLSLNQWDWIFISFATGCLVLMVRLIIQHLSFLRLRRSAKLVLETPVKLYQIDKEIIPFSFGGSIFINQHQHSEEDLKEIIRHEFVHVKQKHSIDMIWAEWLCILNWYNPFAWLIRNAIRQNLEFIADNKVIQNGIDKKQYQYLLLKVFGTPQYTITNNFNFTSLKKRIAMMNKMRSARVHIVRFLFVVPFIAAMLLAFRNQESNHDPIAPEQVTMMQVPALDEMMIDTVPPSSTSPVTAHNRYISPLNSKGFRVTVADNQGECVVIVKNKENRILKAVTLVEWDSNEKEYKSKYGEITPPPPPAPPVPPSPTQPLIEVVPPSPYTPAVAPPALPQMPENITSIHVNNKKLTLTLKNGQREIYDLEIPAQKAAFEKKYGGIPASPQNPKPNSNPGNHPNPAIIPIIIDTKEDNRNYFIPEQKEKDAIQPTKVRKQDFFFVDEAGKIAVKLSINFQGLIVVNDKEYDKYAFENEVNLDADNIKYLEVIKDERARQLYGEKGKNGVIRIVTKLELDL